MEEVQFRSGFVTLIGRPNVGKSTLVNLLLGQKIAAVSPRPQMTRRRQLGIVTTDDYQIIFMDTPGIHHGKDKLDAYMNSTAIETVLDADLVVWIVDASVNPHKEDYMVAEEFSRLPRVPDVLMLLNKIDLLSKTELTQRQELYLELFPSAELCGISALKGENKETFLDLVVGHLPEGPPYYDPEQVTDLYEKEIASDLIRQSCLNMLRDEIPHGIAVRIDEYAEREDGMNYIHATILVERESHKGIVIGKGAKMLKRIGTYARTEIEEMIGQKIYLDLNVKTNKKWRNKPEVLIHLGYSTKRR